MATDGSAPAPGGHVVPERVGPPVSEIGGIEELMARIEACETIEDWSFLLNDYIQWGNNTKVGKHVGIFNLGAAHDCPNRWTERCQVDGDACYAVVDEKRYDYVLDYMRRQEYLWDCLDAETWAEAFLAIVGRKRVESRALKFNQAGDFRHDADVIKADRIAERLADVGIDVFTYTASSHLDWSLADHLTVNRSNDDGEFGARRYRVVESAQEIPDDAVWCVFDRPNGSIGPPNGCARRHRYMAETGDHCGQRFLAVQYRVAGTRLLK